MDQGLDWSDIPYILSVCEAGSLAGAARMMGVNHSTVFRRVEGVEKKLGVRLFERKSHGYVMTPAGELLHRRAAALYQSKNDIELALAGRDLRLEGKLTVTTTDSMLYCLAAVFSAFQVEHPSVDLHVLSYSHALDLRQRDADIALRPTSNPPDHWVGRKLSPILCAVYANETYWGTAKSLPVTKQRWVVLDDDLYQSPMSKLTRQQKHKDAPVTVVNTVMGAFDLVRTGLGIAALPRYLGERCPGLVRVRESESATNWNLWLLAHPDVRRSARVHAFFDYASSSITPDLLSVPDKGHTDCV